MSRRAAPSTALTLLTQLAMSIFSPLSLAARVFRPIIAFFAAKAPSPSSTSAVAESYAKMAHTGRREREPIKPRREVRSFALHRSEISQVKLLQERDAICDLQPNARAESGRREREVLHCSIFRVVEHYFPSSLRVPRFPSLAARNGENREK